MALVELSLMGQFAATDTIDGASSGTPIPHRSGRPPATPRQVSIGCGLLVHSALAAIRIFTTPSARPPMRTTAWQQTVDLEEAIRLVRPAAHVRVTPHVIGAGSVQTLRTTAIQAGTWTASAIAAVSLTIPTVS
jgi:hypothetical protein